MSIEHENIVTVYDHYRQQINGQNELVIVMERCDKVNWDLSNLENQWHFLANLWYETILTVQLHIDSDSSQVWENW